MLSALDLLQIPTPFYVLKHTNNSAGQRISFGLCGALSHQLSSHEQAAQVVKQ